MQQIQPREEQDACIELGVPQVQMRANWRHQNQGKNGRINVPIGTSRAGPSHGLTIFMGNSFQA